METVDSSSVFGRIKENSMTIQIYSFPASPSAIKTEQFWALTVCDGQVCDGQVCDGQVCDGQVCDGQVGRWQLDSMTTRSLS